MNERCVRVRVHGVGRCVRPLLVGMFLAVGTTTHAEELGSRRVGWEPRVPVGKCLTPSGGLLVNERPGQPWQSLDEKDDLHSRDLLLALPGMKAKLATHPLAVELTLWSNLPGLTEFSGLQSAVVLHDSRAFDLDFTLHSGRVLVTNRKEKGTARVWLRVEGEAFLLTLFEPGAAICLGWYSFWPRGVSYNPTPNADHVPARTLALVAVKGQVAVKVGGTQHTLSAPPGPAYFHWDSVNGAEQGSRTRRELPAWANLDAKPSASAKAVREAIDKYQAVAKDREPRTALYDLLAAAEKERDRDHAKALAEFAVFGLAAINDIDRVMQALGDAKQADARRAAVVTLRHWIGDADGRDQRLHQFLIDRLGYTKPQATTVLQLLHSAFPADDPDTYEILIAYLRHDKLAVRQLAWSNLSSLAPEGLSSPYDPAGSEAERAKRAAAWKALIPSGTLPTTKPKKK
ncbi:MAG TPA: hypothetical protein VH643_10570 [Gemmataceae bacterium]